MQSYSTRNEWLQVGWLVSAVRCSEFALTTSNLKYARASSYLPPPENPLSVLDAGPELVTMSVVKKMCQKLLRGAEAASALFLQGRHDGKDAVLSQDARQHVCWPAVFEISYNAMLSSHGSSAVAGISYKAIIPSQGPSSSPPNTAISHSCLLSPALLARAFIMTQLN
jgi:hypothetical protein